MKAADLPVYGQVSPRATEGSKLPHHEGPLGKFNGHARTTGPCCDTMEFWLQISEQRIVDASFTTSGCGSSRAAGSMATEIAIGKRLTEAAQIDQADILGALGGLPEKSEHCALLAANTLKAAMAITSGMTVDQLANADLCYAPPYAPAMDNIITAANVARNKLDGHMVGVSSMEVHRLIEEGADFVLLDVRSPAEYEQVRLPGATLIPLGELRSRVGELPKDKGIITFCKISLRGYEAALILKAAGFTGVRVLDGGIAMWPFEKETH